MTENKYKHLRNLVFSEKPYDHKEEQAIIKIFEEIQQYRAIGTVEEITKLINFLSFDDDTSIIEDLQMLVEYYSIGTVEEFNALKEKEERFDRNIRMFNEIGLEIRAKAIDEFTERIALEISESIIWGMLPTDCKDGVSDEIVDYVIDTSKKIAEQMKAGGIE